jgi:hypothetical protein
MTPIPHRYAFRIMPPRRRAWFGEFYALRHALIGVAQIGLQIGLIMALIGALACLMSYSYQAGWDGMAERLAASWPEGRS